jgi:hypothetical protein
VLDNAFPVMSGAEAVERMHRLFEEQAQGGGRGEGSGAWGGGGGRPLLVLVGGDTATPTKADVRLPSMQHLRYHAQEIYLRQ